MNLSVLMVTLFASRIGVFSGRTQTVGSYMTEKDRATESVMEARQQDWRNGAIVYQVFVDRFAPSANIEAKRRYYEPPRTLHPWSEVPKTGVQNKKIGLWSHELAFWGGDLKSVESKLHYIRGLGIDVLYLNPIQLALTNHKYDAQDWAKVSPEYGTRKDVIDLAHQLHQLNMRLMLDGVFNHMGRTSPRFQDALKNPKSPYRHWFFIGPEYKGGYRAWANVRNLPEVRLESPEVQKYLFGDPDSVVQKYLTDGVDGWRLDTAYELGPKILGDLTQAAHSAKPDSEVVGEIWNYPSGWSQSLDGIMNFYARGIILGLVQGAIKPEVASRMLERMVGDSGIEYLLKSWLILDNHDTDRLRTLFPRTKDRRMAQVLQFTLPGSPVIYYGTELGMKGKGDPGDRAPMRWDLAKPSNPELSWMRRLVAMRRANRALRIGDYVPVDSDRLFAFSRQTERALDSVLVVANPSNEAVSESISPRDWKLMNGGRMKDALGGSTVQSIGGLISVTVPAKTVRVFTMVSLKGYTPYKRVH